MVISQPRAAEFVARFTDGHNSRDTLFRIGDGEKMHVDSRSTRVRDPASLLIEIPSKVAGQPRAIRLIAFLQICVRVRMVHAFRRTTVSCRRLLYCRKLPASRRKSVEADDVERGVRDEVVE